MDEHQDTLELALCRHGIGLSDQQRDQLQQYSQLLWGINEHMNLTRHTTFEKFVGRDVTDSMRLAELLDPGQEVLDVGTGGGIPGIVLAILRPDVQVELCESVAKKAAAVDSIVGQLHLPIPVHHGRVESILEDLRYDVLTARAVGPISKILTWLKPHWASIGRLLLVKGPRWPEERAEARQRGQLNDLEIRKLSTYPIAGTLSEGVILGLWKKSR